MGTLADLRVALPRPGELILGVVVRNVLEGPKQAIVSLQNGQRLIYKRHRRGRWICTEEEVTEAAPA